MANKPLNHATVNQIVGFPQSAKFSGYVIYFPENDEYLHYFEDNEMMKKSGYSKIPNLAIVYSKFSQAQAIAKKVKYKSSVSMLFEDDSRYYLAQDCQNIN